MLKAYSNNGNSWRYVEPDWELIDGEVLFNYEPTEEDLEVAFPGRGDVIVQGVRAKALSEIRVQRSPMLDALSGIAGRASRRGDNATATAADNAADALLNITSLPAFLSATDYDGMKAVIMQRYKEIAMAAPDSVRAVFVEVFGG